MAELPTPLGPASIMSEFETLTSEAPPAGSLLLMTGLMFGLVDVRNTFDSQIVVNFVCLLFSSSFYEMNGRRPHHAL